EVVAPADDVLIALNDRPQRILVLPSAIQLYVAVAEKRGADAPQRTADARRCLDDYLTLARVTQRVPEPREKVAYLQARVAKAEDKPYRVIEILEPVTAQNPLDSTLLRLQAEAYSITDQPRRSIRSLTQYIKLQPRDPAMTLQLAREYLKLRDWNRALQTARLAEPLDPTDIIIKLLRIEANVYVAAERSDKPDTRQLDALSAELADLRKSHPDNVDIRLLQAIVAMNKNDLATAEKELNSAIKECKQTETLRPELQLARLHFRAKRIPEAIEVCRASCQRHPLAAAAWEALAEMQQANETPDEAQATLEKGVATVTDRGEKRSVTLKLAVFHILQGRQKAGIDLLKGLTEKDPHEVYARSILLSLPDVAKDEAAAQKLVDEVRVAEGENGLTWRLRQASLWLSKNDWRTRQQDIAGYLGQCINADPEWSAPTLLLGRMHEQLGNLDRAEEIYRRALSSNPSAQRPPGPRGHRRGRFQPGDQ
ncbi:MAG: tetratricopeptide repeat protein, partial [Planctomycetota bacterium]|nr:tetratricopeptide repeat protein [Planctomycetota bacterium]